MLFLIFGLVGVGVISVVVAAAGGVSESATQENERLVPLSKTPPGATEDTETEPVALVETDPEAQTSAKETDVTGSAADDGHGMGHGSGGKTPGVHSGPDHETDGGDLPKHGGDLPTHDGDFPTHGGDLPTKGDGPSHAHDDPPFPLPKTDKEIEDFVRMVRDSPEKHAHDTDPSKMGEHMAALGLVSRAEATHIAIGHGDWDDPANWHNGEVPDEGAKVLIPEGVHMIYGGINDARLFTLRVDGHLEFADDTDSQIVVDTIVISPSGALTIGTEANPIPDDVNIDIIFANNGAIDTDWDPMLLSRGMIAHGSVNIHGAEKASHAKVIDDPQIGDTWVDFGDVPEGWAVGDTIVIAGTHYEGYYNWEPGAGYSPPEDEIRVITQIEDGQVFFDDPLEFDHDAPRDDLKTSVANYTRNISFETENAEMAEVFERGHVMFMHNDDVDVRFAEFYELGRTDKSEPARNVSEFDQIAFDSNVKGRYAFHFHRAGMGDEDDPGMAVGNAVYGSPGWGFVHHDSNAVLDNNATFDTFGAGYVAESGNETGAWTNNIAIFAQGSSWKPPKMDNDYVNFDLGRTGDGFWFQGRMVESSGNIAASVNHGYVYFHRGTLGDKSNMLFDAEDSLIPEALYNIEGIIPAMHPILGFSDNEVFAARSGLHVVKANPRQEHDVHSVLEDFTAWSVKEGVHLQYTGHYTLKNFDLVGRQDLVHDDGYNKSVGIQMNANNMDLTFVDARLENFDTGIDLKKVFTDENLSPETHSYILVNPKFTNVGTHYKNYDPNLDTILDTKDVPHLAPDVELDGPLTFKVGDPIRDPSTGTVKISGTKTDGLGKTDFPNEVDNYSLNVLEVRNVLQEEGYYTSSEGQNFFMLDIYFSDRLTGDIYYEKHPVLLDENVEVEREDHWFFGTIPFNGVLDLGDEDDPSSDVAKLWAILTDGHPVLTEDRFEGEEEELKPQDAMWCGTDC